MSTLVTTDPATGEPLAEYAASSDPEVNAALGRAAQAGVWTGDPQRGIAVVRRTRSGAAFVNAVVASDVRMPFGGTRASGHGHERGAAGIREFVDVRTWWVLDAPAATAPASE